MNEDLLSAFYRLRREYDALSPGDRAVLRRCRNGEEVQLEGVFWRLMGSAAFPQAIPKSVVAMVVSVFPAVEHRQQRAFRMGRFLANLLDPQREGTASRALRFRQLVRADDQNELCARLRRLLPRAESPVDWAVLGTDIVNSRFDTRVQRQWAQDFFSPVPEEIHERA